MTAGACATPTCAVLGLTPRTLRRWRALAGSDSGLVDRRTCTPRVPANRLSPEEQEAILTVCNAPEYRSLPPTQIVPRLADRAVYLASESSFDRVLRAHDHVHRRGRPAAPRQVPKPQGVCATATNDAWCWDITFLASSIRGQFYRLYLIEDLVSRKIFGWEVHAEESAAHASRMIERACLADARTWVERFVHWYNEEHRHSAIRFVTPGQRHRGEDIAILAHRHRVYQDAQWANPTRWSRHTRNWTPINHVWLNPPKEHAQTPDPVVAQAA